MVGGLFRSLAYGLWTWTPSMLGFAAGFVLWGAGSALISGTFEALVYDELTAFGAADRYGKLVGRAGTLKLLTSAGTTALAVPLLAIGGYALVGAASVGVCLMWSVVALTLPRQPRAESVGGYLATLREGLREAVTRPVLRGVVLLAAAVPGIGVFDEYVPLLGPAYRLPTELVPVFLLGLTLAAAAGNWCAGRWSETRRTGALLALAGLAIAASGLISHPAGFLLVAAAYGLFTFAVVVTGVRLQHTIEGSARATVTSVADVGADITAVAAFALCGAASGRLSVTALIAAFAVPLLALAAATRRWLPSAAPVGTDDS
jgi:hypothetical protein